MKTNKLALIVSCAALCSMTACNETASYCNGANRCDNNVLTICDGNNVKEVIDCAANGQICDTTTLTCITKSTPDCTAGKTACDGDKIKTCADDGTWQEAKDCETAGDVCKTVEGTDKCVPADTKDCEPGKTACDGDKIKTCADDGTWQEAKDCETAGDVCKTVDGTDKCVASATWCDNADELRCNGPVIEKCDHNEWKIDTDCSTNAEGKTSCENNACVECLNDDTKCIYDETNHTHKVYTCNNNAWDDGVACNDGQVCDTKTPSKSCVALNDAIYSLEECGSRFNFCVEVYGIAAVVYCSADGSFGGISICKDNELCGVGEYGSYACLTTTLDPETGACNSTLKECDPSDYPPTDWCIQATGSSYAVPSDPEHDDEICPSTGEKACLIDKSKCKINRCKNRADYDSFCDGNELVSCYGGEEDPYDPSYQLGTHDCTTVQAKINDGTKVSAVCMDDPEIENYAYCHACSPTQLDNCPEVKGEHITGKACTNNYYSPCSVTCETGWHANDDGNGCEKDCTADDDYCDAGKIYSCDTTTGKMHEVGKNCPEPVNADTNAVYGCLTEKTCGFSGCKAGYKVVDGTETCEPDPDYCISGKKRCTADGKVQECEGTTHTWKTPVDCLETVKNSVTVSCSETTNRCYVSLCKEGYFPKGTSSTPNMMCAACSTGETSDGLTCVCDEANHYYGTVDSCKFCDPTSHVWNAVAGTCDEIQDH